LSDPTQGPSFWSGAENLINVLKVAIAPFAAFGGWHAVIKPLVELWRGRGDKEDRRKREEINERDRVKGSLDVRQSAYMDRMERTEARLVADGQKERDEAARAISALEHERDVVWATALDQEQERHDDWHAHIATMQKFNLLLDFFHRHVAGTLSPEALAEVMQLPMLTDPPRVPDVRSRVREASQRLSK